MRWELWQELVIVKWKAAEKEKQNSVGRKGNVTKRRGNWTIWNGANSGMQSKHQEQWLQQPNAERNRRKRNSPRSFLIFALQIKRFPSETQNLLSHCIDVQFHTPIAAAIIIIIIITTTLIF